MSANEREIDRTIELIFDNNRNEALDREQILKKVNCEIVVPGGLTMEHVRLATIRLVDADKIQPAVFKDVLVYCSKNVEVENLHYKEFFVLQEQQRECDCHHE